MRWSVVGCCGIGANANVRQSDGFLRGAAGLLSRRIVYMPAGVLLIMAACFAAGWFAREARSTHIDEAGQVRMGGYSFINPLLECEVGERISRPKSRGMQSVLQSAVEAARSEGRVKSMAVYYRDLNNGPWAGVNGEESFAPASLLKLPTVIAWLKVAELDPRVLQRRFTYAGVQDANANQKFKPTSVLLAGESYTVKELMQRSMAFSDNNADNLLVNNLPVEQLNRAYTDLGIDAVESKTGLDIINVRQYSTFFRVLYNSSYLQRDFSELALWMLSKAEFRSGITAGVPPNLTVAHKFGEREFDNALLQLHDCGIVYHPRSPYLLCIMTRGADMGTLAAEVREVSRVVFEEVDRH